MSRLYNTLEKIRLGERADLPEKKSAPAKGTGRNADPGRKRRIVLLAASALLALSLVVFFAGSKEKKAEPPVTADAVAPARTADDSAESISPAGHSPETPLNPQVSVSISPDGTDNDLYRQLNDTGLALIQENQYWRGIYYLEQARRQQPARPEALINMAVALAELGLRAPAERLFSEAHALTPNHPLLRKNLDLLGQANFFDPQWLSSLSDGQVQPGQTTKPQ